MASNFHHPIGSDGIMSRNFFRCNVGDIEIIVLSDGIAEEPHAEGFIRNASVGQTKAALRAAGISDAHVPIPFTAVVARIGHRLVLIDAGTGGAPVYGPKSGLLMQNMVAAGLDPREIKVILISHLHGDHIYGLMDNETDAQIFPEAEIIVPAIELNWWTAPQARSMDLGPTRKGLSQRIQTTIATWKNVTPIEADVEVLPQVHSIAAYGHSPGQLVYALSSGSEQLLATADVSLLPALFAKHPHWQVNVDQDPIMATETRRRIFDRSVADKAMVTGTHWLMPNIGTIQKDGSSYTFVPVVH
jgi:glyoxylase-like metal-dependent hydrolase (beta-lactamase superfamily II)